jgi:hypothetical protein
MASAKKDKVGDIFVEMAPVFKTYAQCILHNSIIFSYYSDINNFDAALATYKNAIKSSKKFRDFMLVSYLLEIIWNQINTVLDTANNSRRG